MPARADTPDSAAKVHGAVDTLGVLVVVFLAQFPVVGLMMAWLSIEVDLYEFVTRGEIPKLTLANFPARPIFRQVTGSPG
jgi:hypothetical protein